MVTRTVKLILKFVQYTWLYKKCLKVQNITKYKDSNEMKLKLHHQHI